MTPTDTFAVAISGGGHRAALWGLGALLYLADVGLLQRIKSIASVSGGSLLNAYLATAVKSLGEPKKLLGELTADDFESLTCEFAKQIAGSPSVWRTALRGFVIGVLASFAVLVLEICSGQVQGYWLAPIGLTAVATSWTGARSGGTLWGWWGTWAYLNLLVPPSFALLALWWAAHDVWVRVASSVLVGLLWSLAFLQADPGSGRIFSVTNGRRVVLTLHLLVFAALFVVWWLPSGVSTRLACFLLLVLLLGRLLSLRNLVADLAFARTVCGSDGQHTCLAQLNADVQRVFCATEMHGGQHAFFSPDFVYVEGFGLGIPGHLRLSTAAQCSANFPVLFPLRLLPSDRHRFLLADEELRNEPKYLRYARTGKPPRVASAPPTSLILSDGGVYDNLAVAWFMEMESRLKRLARLPFGKEVGPFVTRFSEDEERRCQRQIAGMDRKPSQIIVLNGSPGSRWQPLRALELPWLGELLGISRTMNVLYENMTRPRVGDLKPRVTDRPPPIVLVDIGDHPHLTAADLLADEALAGNPKLDRQAIEKFRGPENLGGFRPASDDPFWISRSTPTTLNPLGTRTTAVILYHAYLQAMLALHSSLGCPMPANPKPSLNEFEQLARGKSRREPVMQPERKE